MKSVRRQQKDIDKTRGRLYRWAEGSADGADGITRTVEVLVTGVARRAGRSAPEVRAALSHPPFAMATRIFAMLLWLTGEDDADRTRSPLARYVAERGRRDSTVGRRWLRQLAESRFELRDVVDMTPDTSLRLGAPREGGAPVTVHEPRFANDHVLGLVVYARLLPMPAGAVLADGLLMLDRHVVTALPSGVRAADVFAIWAADALVAEGHLPGRPSEASREPPPDPRAAPGTTGGPSPGRSDGQARQPSPRNWRWPVGAASSPISGSRTLPSRGRRCSRHATHAASKGAISDSSIRGETPEGTEVRSSLQAPSCGARPRLRSIASGFGMAPRKAR